MAANSTKKLIALLKKVEQQDPSNALLAEMRKRHGVKSTQPVENLVTELLQDSSNTIGRLLTGTVDYAKCVERVAGKVGIKSKDLADDEVQNEMLILQACLKSYFEKLSPKEKEEKIAEIAKELGPQDADIMKTILQGSAATFLVMLQAGSAVATTVLVRTLLVFMGVQTARTTLQIIALAIPFLNIAMGAWLVFDIAGPAYRKVIPSVMNIAILRLTYTEK